MISLALAVWLNVPFLLAGFCLGLVVTGTICEWRGRKVCGRPPKPRHDPVTRRFVSRGER